MSFIDKLIEKAMSQNGVQEEPRGSNSGPKVNEYLRRAGCSPRQPWCMCFLYWCIDEVCLELEIENVTRRTAGCDEFLNWGRNKGIVHDEPKVGDLGFVMASPTDATHVFLVTAVNGNTVHTIEGNTNAGGSRNGYAVCVRQRPAANKKYVRIADVMPAASSTVMYQLVGPRGPITEVEASQGTSWAPVRLVATALGWKNGTPITDADIVWDEDDQAVQINDRPLPSQVMLKNGSSFVPVRKLATFLGYEVSVNGGTITLS